MITQRLTLLAMLGFFCRARAMLVRGPSVTRIRPGFDSMVLMMASVADCFSGARRGGG